MTITALVASDTFNQRRITANLMITRWNNLGTYDAITITGGVINGTIIGGVTPAAGTFTNLTASGTVNFSAATVQFADNSISGNKISGGTAEVAQVELSSPPTIGSHATTKTYVDAATSLNAETNLLYSFILG